MKGYKIIAYNKGRLLFNGMIPAARETVEGKIPVDGKTTGVVHIAIFDPSGNLEADRLCFVPNNLMAAKAPAIEVLEKSKEAKGLNSFVINTSDTVHRPTYFAVVTGRQIPVAWSQQNLVAAVYFEDLVQLPQQADFYIDRNGPLENEALDYLLMSERRGLYDWTYLLSHPDPSIGHAPDNYITYKGKISLDRKPVTNETATVLLNLNDSVNIVRSIKTDDKGEFQINKIVFRDSAKLYFHLTRKTRFYDLYEISLKELWDTAAYTLPLPAVAYELAGSRDDATNVRVQRYAQALSAFDLSGEKASEMMEVVKVQAVRNLTKELERELTTPLFSDPSEITLDFINHDQDTGGSPLLDFLNGRLPGITVNPGEAPQFRGGTVALYIDEMPADVDMINTMPIDHIALVKFLRNSFALGTTNGVLSIYTKRGRLLADAQPGKKPAKFVLLTGYPKVSRYETIDYSTTDVHKTTEDTRSVLLWKPVFNRNAPTINFYNSDDPGSIQIMVTGFDAAGMPFYIRREF